MIPRSFLIGLLLVAFIFSCGRNEKELLQGTWQMVSGTYKTPTDTVTCTDDTRLCYKILGPNHFAVVEMYRENPDSLFFAAVGTFSLEDSVYTETLEGCNIPSMVGKTNTFRSILRGDEWRIIMKTEDMELDEVWKRVKKIPGT